VIESNRQAAKFAKSESRVGVWGGVALAVGIPGKRSAWRWEFGAMGYEPRPFL